MCLFSCDLKQIPVSSQILETRDQINLIHVPAKSVHVSKI